MRAFLMLSSFMLAGLYLQCQPIALTGNWKFAEGDDVSWAQSGFDDAKWQDIAVGRPWEEQGHKGYDGFAWYRIKVRIPSTLRDRSSLKELVKFDMATVDNYDQCYLNGSLIGENGVTIDHAQRENEAAFNKGDIPWNAKRIYLLRSDDPRIHWDQENTIAVRVFDSGGNGGMEMGTPSIAMMDVADYLKINVRDNPIAMDRATGGAQSFVRFSNNSPDHSFRGSLHIRCTNAASRKVLLDTTMIVEAMPRAIDDVSYSIRKKDGEIQRVDICFKEAVSGYVFADKVYLPYCMTPPEPDRPKINCPVLFGASPSRPVRISLPVSGKRPIQVHMSHLPPGLIGDTSTGIITGEVKEKGRYIVHVGAANTYGSDEKDVEIRVSDTIALTPPMGWNSYYAFWNEVTEKNIWETASQMKDSGLVQHGYTYCNVDDGWPGSRNTAGVIQANEKFPDLKALADHIHRQGLRFGIYSSPGPRTCGGFTGSYGHEWQDIRTYAGWGVDLLKYDWCSYDDLGDTRNIDDLKRPYLLMRKCLDSVNRDIVFSICQYGMGDVWTWGRGVGGNCWRTTFDINDNWESLKQIGFQQDKYAAYGGHGGWNDADMLQIGWLRGGRDLHPSNLTAPEQYSQFTLWSLLAAPLMLSCDMEHVDAFTRSVVTNDEVIAVDQDVLGIPGRKIYERKGMRVYVKPLADGSFAVGVFNHSESDTVFRIPFSKLGFGDHPGGHLTVRDCWRQKDVSVRNSSIDIFLPSHGAALYKVSPFGRQSLRVGQQAKLSHDYSNDR
jgi:hypothetical protein